MSKRLNGRRFQVTRRKFAFWVGFGAFSLAERLNAQSLDQLAAFAMKLAPPVLPPNQDGPPEHWRPAENSTWRWFERETYVDGRWKVTGRTTPIHKVTGDAFTGRTGYLSEDLVPERVRQGTLSESSASADAPEDDNSSTEGSVSAVRRARHGRPPSKWLRSLEADELRTWLKSIDVPETGVSGMTFWTHLTRDHFFDPAKLEGLTEDEQAKLHSAAHYGY